MKKMMAIMLVLAILLCSGTAMADGLQLTDRLNAMRVSYLSDWEFLYYEKEDVYVLRFSLKNSNKEYIVSPAKVEFAIKDGTGKVVYEEERDVTRKDYYQWTSILFGEKTMATIYIQPEMIQKSENSKGTVSLKVYLDGYFDFEECLFETDELPTVPLKEIYSLELPELPAEVKRISWSDEVVTKVQITDVRYEFEESYSGDVDLILYLTGEKTYDYEGENHNDTCFIAWKLYDEEGYVVDTGTALTQDVACGEKFKDSEERIYDIKPGHYKLELIDYD